MNGSLTLLIHEFNTFSEVLIISGWNCITV
jgi:hypothetical protein